MTAPTVLPVLPGLPALPVRPALVPASLGADGTISTGETILFAVVALVAVTCGLGLLTARRAVSAAVNMIGIMICLAVLYIAGDAPFLGVTQIVVYTGAVMTLVLFVIMMVGVGGEEPVGTAGSPAGKWGVAALGAVLAVILAVVVWRSVVPVSTDGGGAATLPSAPSELALVLFGGHVVTMELTGVLLIIAAVGALTLTHRQRIRPRPTQRARMEARMRAFADKGAHPGQKPMPGVYAATNAAAAPALAADGEALEESVPRVLRVRDQALELSEVSPEMGAAQRAGTITAREDAAVGLSGMPAMPGAAAPAVDQPVAVDPLTEPATEPADKPAGGPGGQQLPGPSEAGPRQKEEQKK
ncbi:NADH-quinone oxidoreductase subunit J [Actinomyces israelii]|uniref:NADH-quinone oxidoreductase subunit J n=1 Tax=Actinomyces israelii TaxID=1659 RepID=UPI000A077AA6|nr:NADH-quinone oxidoreductase subunit J [Actinomyces israelii]